MKPISEQEKGKRGKKIPSCGALFWYGFHPLRLRKVLGGGMKMVTTLLCLIMLCGIELGLAYLAVQIQSKK